LLTLIALSDPSALRAWQPNLVYYLIKERLHPVEKGYVLQGNNINDLTEIHNMLSKRLEGWEASILEKGIEKGESSLLHRQLPHHFGPLPQWAEDKLAAADSETLEKWGLRFWMPIHLVMCSNSIIAKYSILPQV